MDTVTLNALQKLSEGKATNGEPDGLAAEFLALFRQAAWEFTAEQRKAVDSADNVLIFPGSRNGRDGDR